MASLKQSALEYQPKQTKNIAELPQVSVDLEVFDGSGTDDKGDTFTYKYTVLNGEEYRIPAVVLGQIKDILTESPSVKLVRVKKTGQGLQTRYTTVPIVQ